MANPQHQYRRTLATNIRRAIHDRRFDDAGALLERLKGEAPFAADTRGLELELALESGRLDEARALGTELSKSYPDSARIHYLNGRVLYKHKCYRDAAAAFEASLRLHDHWRSRLWRGKALSQAGLFDQAEAILLELLPQRPDVSRDLAWLYERREEWELALRHVDAYLERHPDDQFIKSQRLRIESQRVSAEDLEDEIATLEALDEEVPPAIIPSYIEQLLTSAQGDKARAYVAKKRAHWDHALKVQVAWKCHQNHAPDLAFDLFLSALDRELANFKLLNALEGCAKRCERQEDLVERYAALAPDQPKLYGRIKRLKRSAE